MKNIIIMSLTALLFLSCKKTRTCDCTTTSSGTTFTRTMQETTKRRAKILCSSYSDHHPSYTDSNGIHPDHTEQISCTLK